ncbi:hypothetical protein [Croceicoccus sp. BE223]|uniref:hypothetical protein n=1 Tax=Croceicoccus sp. BE223 TaxID=2817716 RepID=UPI00285EB601|nr:hypothetical protein [Croceicoccus sp. BE223]MDR7101461.1 hypothetical protein [Croceicoccus sp. BE223]
MTDKRTDQLPEADALDGAELVAIVQGGHSRQAPLGDIAGIPHDHAIEDVAGLQAALDGKAADDHGHTIGDVAGLAAALAAASIATSEEIAGPTYTLALADGANKYKRATNAGGCLITVPPDSDVAFAIDTVVTFRAATAGLVSLVAGGGVTLNRPGGSGGSLNFAEEGATVQIKKVGANAWDVIGGTAAA